MYKLLLATLCLSSLSIFHSVAQTLQSSVDEYRLDPENSTVEWRVNQVGISKYTGLFTRFDAVLKIDPAEPQTAQLAVTIDPTSIRTDFLFADNFDKELSDDKRFFNANQFPQIRFVSTNVTRTGERTAEVTGDLKLLGIAKPLTLNVTLEQSGSPADGNPQNLHFTASGKINRSWFGIVTRTFIADEILLSVNSQFVKP